MEWPGVWPEGWPESLVPRLEGWPESWVRRLEGWGSPQAAWRRPGPGLAAAVAGCQEWWRPAQEPVHSGLEA